MAIVCISVRVIPDPAAAAAIAVLATATMRHLGRDAPVVVGLQRRYSANYREAQKRIAAGALVAGVACWTGLEYWVHPLLTVDN